MIKRISVALFWILAATHTYALNDVIDVASRHRIKSILSVNETIKYYPVILELTSDNELHKLDSLGVKMIKQRDCLALAFVPRNAIEEISQMMSISRVSIGRESFPAIDAARECAGVNKLSSNSEFTTSYDGTGVVVGFADIGFDPNHVNFLDSAGYPSRIKRLVNYVDTLGIQTVLSATSEIAQWSTDRNTEFHATHVAGILTGSYSLNGMQGVAPNAHIVASTSDLYDATILAGVEQVVDYAKSVNLPAVVNLSVGSYTGPHDGTDLFCRYLDKIGEEAIICIAAGNNGHRRNVHKIDLSAEKNEFKTFVNDYFKWDGMYLYGQSDFWSADSRQFQVAVCLYDRTDDKFLYQSPFVGGIGEIAEWSIADSDYAGVVDERNEVFDSCFDGYVYLASELNPENNRYNVMVSYNAKSTEYHTDGKLSRYCLGIIVKSNEEIHIDGYSDGIYSYFVNHGVDGYVSGQSEGSISGIACGNNVIVVGSSNSRDSAPKIDGTTETYNFTTGEVSDYSGYGTLIDGRVLPHICAPGNMVVSSISSPYVDFHAANDTAYIDNTLAMKTTVNKKDYYWYSTCGTSMSSPFAAGVFALWLQADPELTVEEVREIAMTTSDNSADDIMNPRWGAGNIDAYAGLKEVIKRAGVESFDSDNRFLLRRLTENAYEVVCIGAGDIRIRLYSMDGCVVLTRDLSGDTVSFDTSSLPCGVYLLHVETDEQSHIGRIIVSR